VGRPVARFMTSASEISASSFAALASFLPDAPSAANAALPESLAHLSGREAAALHEFELAGRRCLAELGEETLEGLRALSRTEAVAMEAAGVVVEAGEFSKLECRSLGSLGEERDGGDASLSQESMKRMFEEFDHDGKGFISILDFEQVLLQLGAAEHCSDDQIRALAAAADVNGDGFVDFDEFSTWLSSEFNSGNEPGLLPSGEEDLQSCGFDDKKENKPLLTEELDSRVRNMLRSAKAQCHAVELELSEVTSKHKLELKRAEDRLRRTEEQFEDDATASTQFWRAIAKTSASPKLGEVVDLGTAELIGSGRYGFAFKSDRLSDGSPCVAKLMSVRWAHVAIREWYIVQLIAEHPNILVVDYQNVLLHADENQRIAKLLMSAIKEGRFRPLKRTALPDHYICSIQEFMNRGTVQSWMDEDRLSPGGLLAVMQHTAGALSYMHKCGISHNDVKPKNVLLGQEDEANPSAEVIVKLCDFGLATKSADHGNDFTHYGMTALCMTTGEKFGARKFRPELLEALLSDVDKLTLGRTRTGGIEDLPCAAAAAEGTGIGRSRLCFALAELPALLRKIWTRQLTMAEVRDWPCLQGWGFFDGDLEQT